MKATIVAFKPCRECGTCLFCEQPSDAPDFRPIDPLVQPWRLKR